VTKRRPGLTEAIAARSPMAGSSPARGLRLHLVDRLGYIDDA